MKKMLGICAVASFVLSGDLFGWTTEANEGMRVLNEQFDKLNKVTAEKDKLTKANEKLEEEKKESEAAANFFMNGDGDVESLKTLEQKKAAADAEFKGVLTKIDDKGAGMMFNVLGEQGAVAEVSKYFSTLDDAVNGVDVAHFWEQMSALAGRGAVGNVAAGNAMRGLIQNMAESLAYRSVFNACKDEEGEANGYRALISFNDEVKTAFVEEQLKDWNDNFAAGVKAVQMTCDMFNDVAFLNNEDKAVTLKAYWDAKGYLTNEDRVRGVLEYFLAATKDPEKGLRVSTDGGAKRLSRASEFVLWGQVMGLLAKDLGKVTNAGTAVLRPFLSNSADPNSTVVYGEDLSNDLKAKIYVLMYRIARDINKNFE